MPWTLLVIAGLLEVCWAIGLKYTEGFTRLVPSVLTVAAMVGSVVLLAMALAIFWAVGRVIGFDRILGGR